MKRIIVIGPRELKARIQNTAQKLANSFDLHVFDDFVFTSSSWKDKPDGIFIALDLQYQQAKKMRPDLIVCVYPPKEEVRIKKYKVINKAGATMRDPITGAFLDDLPFLTARRKLHEIRIKNQDLSFDIVPYENNND